MEKALEGLKKELTGELHFDKFMRQLYATDASVYYELPLAVAYPKDEKDIRLLIDFATKHKTALIPRAAGTSLAGQCVGSGIVVDVSRHFTGILALDKQKKQIRLEPGVIRDQLNDFLKPHALFFGPNTSTANRCMIGGMVGNNSSGSTSIKYGTTRDCIVSLKGFLANGSLVSFGELSPSEVSQKLSQDDLEGSIYQFLNILLGDTDNRDEILQQFPKQNIHRRNTGYALDALLPSFPFHESKENINLAPLICGSEGTLFFITEVTLQLHDLPPRHTCMVAIHYDSIAAALSSVELVMDVRPYACELIDDIIIACAKENKEQEENSQFLVGSPKAVLLVELKAASTADLSLQTQKLLTTLQEENKAYAFPTLTGREIDKAWSLRKAGLGVLSNLPTKKKAVTCIEDTAVALEDLPSYILDVSTMMKSYGQEAVYYAHAGAGELHLRPLLDLKDEKDRLLFREISERTAKLVKDYQGSLSGEHGDGRLRGEFLPLMVGEKCYQMMCDLKHTFDPHNIFNPNKIIDAPKMDAALRVSNAPSKRIDSFLDFGKEGLLASAERCNGSGDCRKLSGAMCPSYMATRQEKDSTRARANALRTILYEQQNLENEALKDILSLCVSCKACAKECPSNIDMASMKAEFLYQYQQKNGVPLKTLLMTKFSAFSRIGSRFPWLANSILQHKTSSKLLKKILGIAPERTLPVLAPQSLESWYKKKYSPSKDTQQKVYLFLDEFTNYNEAEIGIKAIMLLSQLGFEVLVKQHPESARVLLSKGRLKQAQKIANQQVEIFSNLINEDTPLLGIEPSAILGFRDEYLKLVKPSLREKAKNLAKNCLLFDEFMYEKIISNQVSKTAFTKDSKSYLIHIHCHQKALSDGQKTAFVLGWLPNSTAELLDSSCCGMAGTFGYEKEHYEISMKMGELVLFPAIRKNKENSVIVATGTSCRHQILDGTKAIAKHSIEALWERLLLH